MNFDCSPFRWKFYDFLCIKAYVSNRKSLKYAKKPTLRSNYFKLLKAIQGAATDFEISVLDLIIDTIFNTFASNLIVPLRIQKVMFWAQIEHFVLGFWGEFSNRILEIHMFYMQRRRKITSRSIICSFKSVTVYLVAKNRS